MPAVPGQLELVDAGQCLGDDPGPPPVFLALGEQDGRLVAHVGQQGPVGRDAAPLVPAARVPGEQLVVAGHVADLGVAEDQPGGDAAVEEHGGDGAVRAAQSAVQLRRRLLVLQSGQRHGVGVRGAARCGDGVGRGVEVGHDALSWARASW